MSEVETSQFSCEGCGKSYRWKPELSGRRVKCKCGQVMTVPQPAAPDAQEDLYDLAPTADEDAIKAAFAAARKQAAVAAERAPATVSPSTRSPTSPFIGYQRGPTQREQERASPSVTMDMTRDVYAPVGLLLAGLAAYVGYYAIRYEMSGAGIALTTMGLSIMTAFKALLLIGFAFVVAGPLGVSFGGVWTAILKLAAIAVFADGMATWVDAGVAKIAGGGGGFAGMISFPVTLGVFWLLLIYLFSMDSGDSWMVVMLLAVFNFIVRWVLLLVLLQIVLGWGGVAPTAIPAIAGSTAGASSFADPQVARVTELKEMELLREAREYIKGGRQEAFLKPTEAWYAAGCRKVWFEVERDLVGKAAPVAVIVELPRDKVKDKEKRAKCFEILKTYYEEQNMAYDPSSVVDTGDAYLIVGVR